MRTLKIIAGVAACFVLAGCITGPQASIRSDLVRLGLSSERAKCMAGEIGSRLSGEDIRDVAQFLGNLQGSQSAGNVLDTLLTIDNPRAAAVFTRAGISCAF